MVEIDFHLKIYYKQLSRINTRVKLVEQLKRTPYIYLYSIKETIRRLNFSKVYKQVKKKRRL